MIITTDNVDVGTVDNQENVEPDNRKDPARFAFLISSCCTDAHHHQDDRP